MHQHGRNRPNEAIKRYISVCLCARICACACACVRVRECMCLIVSIYERGTMRCFYWISDFFFILEKKTYSEQYFWKLSPFSLSKRSCLTGGGGQISPKRQNKFAPSILQNYVSKQTSTHQYPFLDIRKIKIAPKT